MSEPVRVLVVGLGSMGCSHALAYDADPGFAIVGLANRSSVELPAALRSYPLYAEFGEALAATRPDLAAVCTYPESHAECSIAALKAGAHVFVEKPIATTAADARRVADAAAAAGRKLVVGYILRHHPSWQRLIAEARALGGPYVFRLNLNQQSAGATWEVHKKLMRSASPIVDCGVHYVDVMCQIADSPPIEVRGMGARLTDEIEQDMYNYGHFQVIFADGSVGWYEAGWGPMISETAYFVKDVITPRGCVSIVEDSAGASADIEGHTKVGALRIHRSACSADGTFAEADEIASMPGEPGHQELCALEQAYVLKAIREDLDLDRHHEDAVRSLRVCLAADESIRSGRPVALQD